MAVTTNFGVPVNGDAQSTLMPKLQYRFRVTFTGLGNESGNLVTTNVVSATRPSLEHEDVTIDTYNSKIRLAGKHTWQDVTIVLRDDMNNNVIKAIDTQLSKQVNHADQSSAAAGTNYKFAMKIQTLDGSNPAGDEGVIDTWEMVGCFVPSVQYGDLNYADSSMVQITMTVRYDNASHTGDNLADDQLSEGPTQAPSAGDLGATS